MLLSYWLRLVCLVLFSIGLIQAALALLLRLQAPAINRALARLSARWQERACFAFGLVSHLAAFVLAVAVVVPQYIRNEANSLNEHVGILCITGACLVAARYAYGLLRVLSLIRRALAQRRPGIAISIAGLPVWLMQSEHPLLAVEGLLSPRIVASRGLLDHLPLGSNECEIALAHENAHARHFDNLKLLALMSLSLPFGESQVRLWHRAAEIAADSDAVGGSRTRAILLAETLVAIARSVPDQPSGVLALSLLPHEADLETRIHCLLEEKAISVPRNKQFIWLGAGLILLAAFNLLFPLLVAFSHEFAEFLLHIG